MGDPSFVQVHGSSACLLASIRRAPPSMGPFYVGDGKGEDSLSPTYTDGDGETVISITKYMQSVNVTNPGPYVAVAVSQSR